MMKNSKEILQKKQSIRKEMDKAVPKAQGDVLWKASEDRLAAILEKYRGIPEGYRIHTDKHIFPSAAVYLTLKDAVGQETAYKVIENAAVKETAAVARKLAGLLRMPGMRTLFIRMWNPMVKKIFAEDNGFRNVFYPKEKNAYRMDIISCPYSRYLSELGCPELTKIFCENDVRVYGHLPGLRFERSGTLGKGADRCDFCIRKDEGKDAL